MKLKEEGKKTLLLINKAQLICTTESSHYVLCNLIVIMTNIDINYEPKTHFDTFLMRYVRLK